MFTELKNLFFGWMHNPTESEIQEIFNRIIEKGYYSGDNCSTRFMCNAIAHAWNDGKITTLEKDIATKEVDGYMNYLNKTYGAKSKTLLESLRQSFPERYDEKGDIFNPCFQIYKDWKNRPL